MKLRPMKMSDAMLMLEWKNYPETRKFAIVSSRKIKLQDHLRWLPKNLKYFKIIEEDGIALGAIRVENREISIWIDRALWNLGYAKMAIKRVARKGYRAKIVNDNKASIAAFKACGFKQVLCFANLDYCIYKK